MLPFLRGDVRQEPAPGPRLGAGAALVAQRSAPGTAARGGYGSSRALGPLLGPGTRHRLGLALPLPGQSQETASGWAWLKSTEQEGSELGESSEVEGGAAEKATLRMLRAAPLQETCFRTESLRSWSGGGAGGRSLQMCGSPWLGGHREEPPGSCAPAPGAPRDPGPTSADGCSCILAAAQGGHRLVLPPEQTLGPRRENHRSQELHHRQGSCQGISSRAVPSSSRGCSWPIRSSACSVAPEDPS